MDDPQPFGFDAGVDSIAVSGQNSSARRCRAAWPGPPPPCGPRGAERRVRRLHGHNDRRQPQRHKPLILWSAIQRRGEGGLGPRPPGTGRLCDCQVRGRRPRAWRHKNSITVVFPRPGDEVIARWQIAPSRDIAHIITLPHVTRRMIDRLSPTCRFVWNPQEIAREADHHHHAAGPSGDPGRYC